MDKRAALGGGALMVAGFSAAVLGASQQSFALMVAGVVLILPGVFVVWRFYVSITSGE